MKLLHTSDLHIGKRVNEFSMIEDQEYILQQMLDIIDDHKPDGIMIAGDVYDRTVPTVEAVRLFDWFLTELNRRDQYIFIVSGNHDSADRLNFGGRIMEQNKIYIAGRFEGELDRLVLEDEHGPLNIYMLPFVKPVLVRPYYPEVETYEDAVDSILKNANIDYKQRNILIAHQFIISGQNVPEQSESEAISIGGLDHIDASVFDGLDYVALGHLHGPQRIGQDTIRYAGSPLKYSFSEVKQKKSVTMVEMGEKGQVSFEKIPLTPIRDMREIKGEIDKLLDPENYSKANTMDYIRAILTDEEEIYDAIGKMRSVYPNIMRLELENSKSMWNSDSRLIADDIESKTAMELFEEFYINQNNIPMSKGQKDIMLDLFEEVVGE